MSGKSSHALQDIENPLDHDVLGGRGGASYRHQGNMTYRKLVQLNKPKYALCQKMEKMKISKSIVQAIRSQDPPGRFLEKDSKSGFWNDIGDKKAIEKTSQALREGQPDIRKNMEKLNANNLPIIDVSNCVDSGVVAGADMNSFITNNNQRNPMLAPIPNINHLNVGRGGVPAELTGSLNSLMSNGTTQAVMGDVIGCNTSSRIPMNTHVNSHTNPNLQSNAPINQISFSRSVPSVQQSALDVNKNSVPLSYASPTLHAGAVNLLSHQYQLHQNNVNYGVNAHNIHNFKKDYFVSDSSVILASSNHKVDGGSSGQPSRSGGNRDNEGNCDPELVKSLKDAVIAQLLREKSLSKLIEDSAKAQSGRDEYEDSLNHLVDSTVQRKGIGLKKVQRRSLSPNPRKSCLKKVQRRSLSPKPQKVSGEKKRTGILKKESSYSRKITENDQRSCFKKEKSQTSVGTFSIDSSIENMSNVRPGNFFRQLSARRRNDNPARNSMVSQITDPFQMMDLDLDDDECDKLNEALNEDDDSNNGNDEDDDDEDDDDDDDDLNSKNQIKLVFGNDEEETEELSKVQSGSISAVKLSSLDDSVDPWDKYSDKYTGAGSRRGSRSTRSSFLSTDMLTEFSAISEAEESIATMDFSAGYPN